MRVDPTGNIFVSSSTGGPSSLRQIHRFTAAVGNSLLAAQYYEALANLQRTVMKL